MREEGVREEGGGERGGGGEQGFDPPFVYPSDAVLIRLGTLGSVALVDLRSHRT